MQHDGIAYIDTAMAHAGGIVGLSLIHIYEKMLVSSFACSYETADIEFELLLSQAMQKGNNLAHHLIPVSYTHLRIRMLCSCFGRAANALATSALSMCRSQP